MSPPPRIARFASRELIPSPDDSFSRGFVTKSSDVLRNAYVIYFVKNLREKIKLFPSVAKGELKIKLKRKVPESNMKVSCCYEK